MELDMIRKLPFSLEAEQSVLGSLLIKPDSFEKIAAILTAEDFYTEEHKVIFGILQRMFMQSRTVDTVILMDELAKEGKKDEAANIQYVTQLATAVPSAANVLDYAKIVRDKAVLRRLISVAEEIADMSYAESGEASAIVDAAEQKIFELAQNRDSKEFRHIKDILGNVYQELVLKSEHKAESTGTRTGFSGIDKVLVQMGRGDLVLVGARPGMGKTSFAMNIATNVAKSTKKAVCIFSLEMSGEQLVNRMLSSEALVDSYSLRSGELKPEDWERLADATSELAGCEILIDDTSGITATDMKAKLRRVRNLGLVVIDYLQLMQSGRNIENRVQEVGDISRNLKIMAKDLGVPIICCAQLSRGPESRTVKKPMLSDLRDSGAIEQDADIVMFLYREEYYKDAEGAKDNIAVNTAEVIIAKNRHGSTGTVEMGWNGQFTKFRTVDDDREPAPGT